MRRVRSSRRVKLAYLLVGALALQGCASVLIGAGATVGVTAAQERGVKGAISDTGIRAEINHLWLQKNHQIFIDINLQIHEGRVLVTGATKDSQLRADAIQLAWRASGVREVINEVEITDEGGVVNYARDTAINTELRARLLFAKDVDSINYSIETVNGAVYVLGVAQDKNELERVIEIARNVANVRRVVSYVLLKDDPRRFAKPPAS
jgi:osmotically-inducible protein OsmY